MMAPMNIEITRGHGACFQRFTHETHGARGFHLSAWLFATEVTWDRRRYTLEALSTVGRSDGLSEISYYGIGPIHLTKLERLDLNNDDDYDALYDWRRPFFLDDILPNSSVVFLDHDDEEMEYVGPLIHQNWKTGQRV